MTKLLPSKLTAIEISALLDEAVYAWAHAGKTQRLHFAWKDIPFVSTIDALSITVETLDGKPVAVRYHY